ncbi:MAG: 1-acyl-sn-glycerol-3-phosphate acyltransferase [Rhodospirillales bacterium]|nr:1-acyl-sn-glycerol-3-phosphate acyltransferase [Rhodospirillales bacterium]
MASPLRALWRSLVYLALTLPLMPVQALGLAAGAGFTRRLPVVYNRLVCRLLGLRVEASGEIAPVQPVLFIANHVSYFDIAILSSLVDTCFVAKREVAGWPLFGWLAKLQRTVFIARRRGGVTDERDGVVHRLSEGRNVVLFAEGTSGDGNRILPFKSALFSVAQATIDGRPLVVQPVSLAYTRLDGMPLGRQWRPFVAWYGDMDMAPHLWTAIGLGRLTVMVEFHRPATMAEFGTRKALAGYCERQVASGLAAANSGRRPASLAPPEAVAANPATNPATGT